MASEKIEIEATVAAELRAQAATHNLPVSEFLKQSILGNYANLTQILSDAEWNRALDELSSPGPALPQDFSRADMYSDHD
jgi:hypothetical protein